MGILPYGTFKRKSTKKDEAEGFPLDLLACFSI